MKRSKDLFREMLEDLFFGDPLERMFQEHRKQEELEWEQFETEKQGIRTILKCGFDQNGYVRQVSYQSIYKPTEQESTENQQQLLQKQLDAAVEEQNYELAAEIQSKLRTLTN